MSETHAGNVDRVVAIVLNWNGLDDTVGCVRSLLASGADNLEVLVVDNGSAVFDADRVTSLAANVSVVRNEENLGYCGGNNVGIEWALARGAAWVWVLNNDLTIRDGALGAMLTLGDRRPRAAAIGGRVYYADRDGLLWMAWGRVTWLQSLIGIVGQDCADGPEFDGEREVEWIPGCSILMRAAALRELGGFDPEFFAYHEDVDWAARARACGWELWYTGDAAVDHRVHASSGGQSTYGGFRKYLSARNSVLYARRHGRPHQRLLMAVAIVCTVPFQILRRLPTGEAGGVVMKIRGWLDALRGRPIPLKELGLRD